jgi:hypothetical protein
MAPAFGLEVKNNSDQLQKSGMDPNQIANVLWKKDKGGHNYGIGIILDDKGKAMASSATLLKYAKEELGKSTSGDYKNSNAILEDVKKSVLAWQRIPEPHWGRFKLILPSDAGTGAVETALHIALMLDKSINTLGIEELGWPAYRTMAKANRLGVKEYGQDALISDAGVLPIYQAGPMNTTGQVKSREIIVARAQKGVQSKTTVILDRAYSGFEFARDLATKSYDDIMKMSYELQVKPFIESGTPFLMALSPTKAFLTFSLRPCGFFLLFNPDPSKDGEMTNLLNAAVRARGSSFEHPITRAFAQAMVKDRAKFEEEHLGALKRLAEVEIQWKKLVKGTAIEYLFSNHYAGLFRNPLANPDAAENIYNEHLYPVFSSGRCRLNATGLPADPALSQKHVSVFATYCH